MLRCELDTFVQHTQRQIDPIQRRVLQDETIPHKEKVFSLFEPHTEWISKGKAGVPVALGLRVCVVESAINALEVHGLDKCPDHGIDGFKRYVALAVVARNIQRLGAVLRQQVQEKEQRKCGCYKKKAA